MSSHFVSLGALTIACRAPFGIQSQEVESINLSHNLRVFAGDLANIFSSCKRITDVDLSYGTSWVNFEVIHAVAVNCPKLRKFVLDGCNALCDDSIQLLAQHCHELRYLNVNMCNSLTDNSLRALSAGCGELCTFLILCAPRVTSDGIISLAQGCTKLEEVGLPQCDKQIYFAVAALVQHCPALCVLRCWSPYFTDESLQALEPCKHFHTLELNCANKISSYGLMQLLSHCDMQRLELPAFQGQCPATDGMAAPLLTCTCLRLRFVSFKCSTSLTDEVIKVLTLQSPNLVELNVQECTGLTEASFLATAANCKKLESLNISHVPASDAALCALAENCPNLHTLHASRCSLPTDAALSSLAQHCSYLRHLDMSYCSSVTDAGVEEILQKCRQLRRMMFVDCTQLTSKVLDSTIQYGARLRYIDLTKCHKIDNSAVVAFRSAKPNCELTKITTA